MVSYPEDGEGPGHFSILGCKETHQELAAATDGWKVVLPASDGGTGGSGARGEK